MNTLATLRLLTRLSVVAVVTGALVASCDRKPAPAPPAQTTTSPAVQAPQSPPVAQLPPRHESTPAPAPVVPVTALPAPPTAVAPAVRQTAEYRQAIEDRVKFIYKSGRGESHTEEVTRGLARAGDDASIDVLIRLAQDGGLMAQCAVAALGKVRGEPCIARTAEVLKVYLADSNAVTAAAAVGSYVHLKGDESIPDVQVLLQHNVDRPDGHGLKVCAAAVQALGELDTPAADRALIEELQHVDRPTWQLEYGTEVLTALLKPNLKNAQRQVRGFWVPRPKRPFSPEYRGAVMTYVEGLRARMPGSDNTPGRTYYEAKIADAQKQLTTAEAAAATTPAADSATPR